MYLLTHLADCLHTAVCPVGVDWDTASVVSAVPSAPVQMIRVLDTEFAEDMVLRLVACLARVVSVAGILQTAGRAIQLAGKVMHLVDREIHPAGIASVASAHRHVHRHRTGCRRDLMVPRTAQLMQWHR